MPKQAEGTRPGPEPHPNAKLAKADDFLKTQVYSHSSLTFSSNGKLSKSPNAHDHRPVVTLTFAQSFDAKIAGKNGKQIQLSGPESSVMTHRLRAMHTHIMVGAGTLLNDDPQLNCRLPELLPLEQQPIPCVLDNDLRTPLDCKLIRNAKAGIGHFPLILAQKRRSPANDSSHSDALRAAGCTILLAEPSEDEHSTSKESRKTRRLSLEAIVKAFGLTGEHSLMIEGGASVISTILATYASSSFCNLDRVIVTIAPTYVGEDGIAIRLEKEGTIGSMQPMASKSFGRDVVIAYDFTNEG